MRKCVHMLGLRSLECAHLMVKGGKPLLPKRQAAKQAQRGFAFARLNMLDALDAISMLQLLHAHAEARLWKQRKKSERSRHRQLLRVDRPYGMALHLSDSS